MKWQPIETAPKETALLLATEFFGAGDWRIKCGSFYGGEWHVWGASWTPSHWMPLPAAPGAEPQGPAMDADGERYPAPAAPSEAEIAAAREHISDVHNATQMRSALSQLRPEVVVELVARGLVPSIYAPMAAAPQAPAQEAPAAPLLQALQVSRQPDCPEGHVLRDWARGWNECAAYVERAALAAAPQAPAAPTAAALDIDRAAKKLAELFDYPWEHMLADGRQNMRKNAEAVLLAAGFKESP